MIVDAVSDEIWNWAATRTSQLFGEKGREDPVVNFELQRSIRKSQLRATEELTRVALERARASSSVLLSDEPVLKKVLQAVRDELEALPNQALTEVQIADADLLVLDEGTASPDQLGQMRQRQEQDLRKDIRDWTDSDTLPVGIDDLPKNGWTIELPSGDSLDRDWHTLIAIAFMDELKNNEPARAIFDSSILAELKNRDERLDPISNFEGFEREFG